MDGERIETGKKNHLGDRINVLTETRTAGKRKRPRTFLHNDGTNTQNENKRQSPRRRQTTSLYIMPVKLFTLSDPDQRRQPLQLPEWLRLVKRV